MRISIVGITGYSGMELLRILLQHSQAEVVSLHASQDMESPVSELYPQQHQNRVRYGQDQIIEICISIYKILSVFGR